MTILGALAKRASLETPTLPLTSTALAEWLSGGKSLAGVPVSERRALGITAYFRAIALMAGSIAPLPLKIYRDNTRERILQRTVLDSPNTMQTPFEFWQTMVANAVSWGNAYAQKVRDGSDRVVAAWPIHPSRTRVDLVDGPDGVPAKLFIVSDRRGQEHRWTSREVMQLPYLAPDGTVGLSPLRMARETLGITVAAEDYAARFFGNGVKLSGVLTSKLSLTEEKADRLKARWRAKVAGPEHEHDIAVLDNDTTFTPISVPPEDAQLLATRQWQVNEIARLFGIPPHMLGDVEKSTSWGQGIEQQVLGFVKFTLQPWLSLIEQRVTRELLPGGWTSGSWYAEFTLEGLLRGDAAARAAFYAQAVQWGWLNRNEVRVRENLEPAEGLDEFLTPSNMTLISVDGKFVPLGGAGPGGTDAQGGG